MFVDILPNVLAPIIVYATLLIPLSHRDRGVTVLPRRRHSPAHGRLGADDQLGAEISTSTAPGGTWCSPSVALLVTTLAFNIFGDGVRDAFDPRGDQLFV